MAVSAARRVVGGLGRVALILSAFAAALVVPIVILAVVLFLLVSSIAIGPCNLNVDVRKDRQDCARSTLGLVRAAVQRGAGPVKAELAAHPDTNRPDKAGNRALPCAAMVGNEPAVRALLESGASASASGNTGGRPIVAAVSGEGRVGNEPSTGRSQVDFASVDDPDRIAIVQLLIYHGASATDALSPAAERGSAAMVAALLDAGADPTGDPAGPSPLLSAVFGGSEKSAGVLLAHGADPNRGGLVSSAEVIAALATTASGPSASIPNLPPSGEVPPVVAAVVQGQLVDGRGILTDLIEAGADPNKPAFGRYTALWVAALTRNHPAALVLRAAAAEPDPPGLASATAVAKANSDDLMLSILAG